MPAQYFETGAGFTKMAQEWQATLPNQPDPTCISTAVRGKATPPIMKWGEK